MTVAGYHVHAVGTRADSMQGGKTTRELAGHYNDTNRRSSDLTWD